ncbi:unnamed protein product [Rhizopus microsporus]
MGKIVFNEDEEIVVPEPVVKKPEQIEEQISDDDEAPEAISTSTAKQTSLFKANLEKEAAANKQKKKAEKKEEKKEESEDEPELLPEDLLAQAIAEEKEESKKRTHITADDFERMMAEEEEREKAKKRRMTVRRVGEYTVKVLNQRPKAEKKNKNLINLKKTKLHRKAVPRKDAVQNISSGRDGAALVFRRK